LALFAGWGALWVVTAPRQRLAVTARDVTLSGFLLSVCVETVQLFSPIRQTSVLDLITNTLGALAGALVIVAMIDIAVKLKGNKSYFGLPAIAFAGPYACAVFVQAAVLARPIPIPGVYGNPFVRFGASMRESQLLSFGGLGITDLFLFLPLGAFLVTALVEAGWIHRRAARLSIAIGVALCLAAELSRGTIALRMSGGAFLLHSLAIALGALAAAKWLPVMSRQLRGRERPLALAAIYAVCLLLWSWQPYLLETDFQAIAEQLSLGRLVPLNAHGWRVDVYSVADIVAPFFLFLPVGGLLAVWPLRRAGWLAHLLPGLYLAVGTELGQVLVVDRFFGGTDLIVQCAGVAIGWMVVRMAGYTTHGVILPK
jgi:glycopeptide antibiotics resistance protein